MRMLLFPVAIDNVSSDATTGIPPRLQETEAAHRRPEGQKETDKSPGKSSGRAARTA